MIRLITDSVAAFSPADRKRLGGNVDVLSLFVNHDGQEFVETEMDVDAFYGSIHDMVSNIPTSSQPSAQSFENAFERAAVAGDSVLGVFMSSSMSGTYEGALRAARSVKARHASFDYALIDSTSNCGDEGMVVMDAYDAIKAGRSLSHVAQSALLAVQSSRFLFAPESLAFLKAGGRIGGAAALLGSLIQMTPVLTVRDAKTESVAKVRSRAKALKVMQDQLVRDMKLHGGIKRIIVHYIGDRKPAQDWARKALEPLVGLELTVVAVSPVIGVHVGPAVGVAYECNLPLLDKFSGNIQHCLCTH